MNDTTDRVKTAIKHAAGELTDDTPPQIQPNWYLRVKTLNEEHQVDIGASEEVARAALEEAKELMRETGAVTIAGGLVVNASDIVSLSLHDQPIAKRPKRT